MFNSLFKKKQKDNKEYIIALCLDGDYIAATVFSVDENKTKIEDSFFEKTPENLDDLIQSTDSAISKAAGNINLNEIKKVIFGLPQNYIDNDNIRRDKLEDFKKLTQELELTPSGFVSIPEAINFYITNIENNSLTCILLGISSKDINICLVRGGKISQNITSPRGGLLAKDVIESFKKLEADIYPSKIILYGFESLEGIKDELLKVPWQEEEKFLHFPKIEIIAREIITKGVIEAVARHSSIKNLDYQEVVEEKPEGVKVSPSDLGFLKDNREEEVTKDIQLQPQKHSFSNHYQKDSEPQSDQQQHTTYPKRDLRLLRFISFLKIPKLSLVGLSRFRSIGLIPFLLLILLAGGYAIASYQLPKATLTLIVDSKNFQQEKELTINPNITSIVQASSEIPAKTLQTEVSGSKSISTSGKKLVGDKAKGEITIYNKTTEVHEFNAETQISAGEIQFSLDKSVEVPPASESVEGLTYGKSNISVIASKIGQNGNLTSQTEFKIGDFSSSQFMGRNDNAFSGGTSREVSVVSSKDQDQLFKDLQNELKEKAKSDLQSKLVEAEKIVEGSETYEIINKEFSNEVDQETKELGLNLQIKVNVLTYQESNFLTIMEAVIKENIPAGFEYRENEIEVKISKVDNSEDNFKFKATLSAHLYPLIDVEKIKNEIKGYSLDDMNKHMKSVKDVVGYEIDVDSPFSLFKDRVPKLTKNITVEVKAR